MFFRRREIENSPAPVSALIDALESHPAFTGLAAEVSAEQQARRDRIGDELAAIERRIRTEVPPLAARRDRALAVVEQIEPQYEAAVSAYRVANEAHRAIEADLQRRAERLRHDLAATASPMFADAKRQLQLEISGLGRLGKTILIRTDTRLDGKVDKIFESNVASIEERRAALREAIFAIEAMEREPDPGDVEARLEALYGALPSAERMTRFTAS